MVRGTAARSRSNLTADDLASLPTGMGKRYELIEGKLVTLAPTKILHGITTNRISLLLNLYNAEHKLGTLVAAETGFYTRGNDRTVRAPDVAFISFKRLPAEKLKAAGRDFGTVPPDLIVEVVSPSDKTSETEDKVQEWLDFGVAVVWVVYPEKQRMHVFSGDQSRILHADDRLDGGEALPGFDTPVSAFFED